MPVFKDDLRNYQNLVSKTCQVFPITRPNCALDRRTILCLYDPGFQRQAFKNVKTLSEQSNKINEQEKIKGRVLVVESTYNSQNAQFGHVLPGLNASFRHLH